MQQMSPSVQIAGLVCTMLLGMLNAWIGYMMWRFVQEQRTQFVQVREDSAEVKQTLQTSTVQTARKLDNANATTALQLKEAAHQATEVKLALEASNIIKAEANEVATKKLDDLAVVADRLAVVAQSTHTLANSGRGELLKELAVTRRALADEKPSVENLRNAELAEANYAEHQTSQGIVDAQPGTDEAKKGNPPELPPHPHVG